VKANAESGAHLLELLLWLLLSTALITVALPALAVLSEEETLRLEAERVQSALHEARTQAEAFDRLVVMTIEPHELASYWESRQGKKLLWVRVNNRVTLRVSSSKPNEITFFRTGVVTPATLLVLGNKANCTIRVSLRGRITRSCHWATKGN